MFKKTKKGKKTIIVVKQAAQGETENNKNGINNPKPSSPPALPASLPP